MTSPDTPALKGLRKLDGRVHTCASETRLVGSKHVPYEDGSGGVTVDIFRAHEPKDVGVVIRVTSQGDVGFVARAVPVENGVELHLAGGRAEESLLGALHAAIGELWLREKVLAAGD